MARPVTIPFPFSPRFYYGWVIAGIALIINMMSAPLNAVIFSFFISPMSHDLGAGRSDIAWALTFRLVVGGLTAPLLGLAIDRLGVRWLGAFAGLIAGSAIMGLSITHDLWLLYLLSAISGASGLGGPGGNLLTQVPVAKWFVAKRGRVMAITAVGSAAGTVVGIPIAQWLISSLGWRGTWLFFGSAICGLIVPLSAAFMRRNPEDLGLRPDGLVETPDPVNDSTKRTSKPYTVATETDWTVSQALRTPALWIIMAALALIGLSLSGTLALRVSFWKDIGLSPGLVAFGTATDPFTVIFSSLAFGILGERIRTRYLGLIAGVGFALSMLPMIFTTGQGYTIFAHSMSWGAAAGSYLTVNNLIWPDYFGRKFLGTIRGVVLPVSIAASGLGPPLYGYLLDAGLEPARVWTISLGLFATAGVLILVAKPPRLAAHRPTRGERIVQREQS